MLQINRMILVLGFLCYNYGFVYAELIILEYSDNSINIIKFKLPQYSIKNIEIENNVYSTISIEGASLMMDEGVPELPYFTTSLSVSGSGDVSSEIIEIEYEKLNLKNTLISSKGNLSRSINKDEIPFTFGEVYNKNSFYPDHNILFRKPYVIHGIKGQVINIQPFQYNAVTNELKVAKSIKLKVYETGLSNVNSVKIGKTFNSVLKRHFINYENISSRYDTIPDNDRMIIITHADFKDQIEPFVLWKNRIGIKTDLFVYPDETGGEGAEALHTFLKGEYNREKMAYILIVGDHEYVPSMILTIKNKPYASDPSFTKLDGEDYFPDAFIGRFSVETPEQAEIVINKSLKYEQTPDHTASWYKKTIGIASSESGLGDTSDIMWMRRFNKSLSEYKYSYIDSIYQGDEHVVNDLRDYINDGRGLINFMGHGLSTGFGFRQGFWFADYNVRKLINGDKLPVIIATACYNGRFHNRTCFAEEWQRLETGGALVYLGASPELDWTPPQIAHEEMINLITNENFLSTGAVIYNGEIKMLEKLGDKAEKSFHTWNVFGDPSVVMFTDTPKEINFDINNKITTGNQKVSVSISKAMDGRIGIYGDVNGYIGSKVIKENSTIDININVPSNETNVTITITGRNVKPISKYLSVGPTNISLVKDCLKPIKVDIKQGSGSIAFKINGNDKYHVTLWNLLGQKIVSFGSSKNSEWQRINIPAKGLHFLTVESDKISYRSKYLNLR